LKQLKLPNLLKHGFGEIETSRGGSSYVIKKGDLYLAFVVEGLGTKNLVADEMEKIAGKSFYEVIAHDTVATIINDLITVGATPLVINAYWAFGDNQFLKNEKRMKALIYGWRKACDLAGVVWGGGESPTLKGIINPESCDLAGAALGIIKSKKRLITEEGLKEGDRIILLKSNGINANGLSLARAVAKKLPQGYATLLPDGKAFGQALLQKTNIYSQLLEELFCSGIKIHYLSNITGHGLKKVMRAKRSFNYVIEKIFPPDELFLFIQKHSHLSDFEMYQTFNMGMDYAIFCRKER
jgi:phosphoribosylformylglycinamidine cyclo-ligase